MISRCEDAPACGHIECGFGPGVPGYGSMVNGLPYYGEHKPLDDDTLPTPAYDLVRHTVDELRRELRVMRVADQRATPNGATMFSRALDSIEAWVDEHESSRKSSTDTKG